MRVMYDSTRPGEIPADAQIVAGYVDGRYAWSAADWARFPNAVRVEISAIGTDRGTVVDVEVGCVWPVENAVPWVQRARARGVDPTVYCNWQNDLHRVKAAFIRAGVAEPHYWVAKYDGVREVPAGTIGKQHSAPEAPGKARAPAHYDISSMADHWPGVDASDPGSGGGTKPTDPTTRKRQRTMEFIAIIVAYGANETYPLGWACWVNMKTGASYWHPSAADLKVEFDKKGHLVLSVDAATADRYRLGLAEGKEVTRVDVVGDGIGEV